MNLWFRLLLMLLRRPWRKPAQALSTTVVRMRVWPLDLDFNRHVTNGRSFTLADVGRMDYVLRSGAFRVAHRVDEQDASGCILRCMLLVWCCHDYSFRMMLR